MEWVQQKASSGTQRLRYEIGTVKRVEPAGMGDRCGRSTTTSSLSITARLLSCTPCHTAG
jgi:hypothetical protein